MIVAANNDKKLNWDFLREQLEASNIVKLTGFFDLKDLEYITNISLTENSKNFVRQQSRAPSAYHDLKHEEVDYQPTPEELTAISPAARADHSFRMANYLSENPSVKWNYEITHLSRVIKLGQNKYRYAAHSKMFGTIYDIYKKLIPQAPLENHFRKHILKYHNNSYFAPHRHKYEPQKYGLILLVSQRGEDYVEGGTQFYMNNTTVDTSNIENRGDIFIFRYDIPHAVKKTTCTEEQAGRLTAIMPWFEN